MERITLGEWMHKVQMRDEDRDIAVDGCDMIAYCGTRLTPAGIAVYGSVLGLPMEGDCVVSDDDADYEFFDEEGEPNQDSKLIKAWEMLSSMAGYCDSDFYDSMFE